MIQEVTKLNIEEYNQFVWNHKKGHFMQAPEWGKHKSDWKWRAVICRDEQNGQIKGSLALLIRRLPGLPWSMMYGARGPVWDESDPDTLSELIDAAKKIAKETRSYSLILDPDIAMDQSQPPEAQPVYKQLKDMGFNPPAETYNFESVQPRYVFRLWLNGRSEEEVFESFESKTRYNLRLAGRKGVEVKICGKEMVADFCRIMNETGERDNFIVRGEDYFTSMLDKLGENARLYMAFYEEKPIAGTLAIHYGNKVWYLYGASSNAHRNVMPNYLLQWEMIRWAIETKCDVYDFRGVSGNLDPENPLYGLYRFKKGFNGDFTEFIGQFEMVYKPFALWAVGKARRIRHALYKITHKIK